MTSLLQWFRPKTAASWSSNSICLPVGERVLDSFYSSDSPFRDEAAASIRLCCISFLYAILWPYCLARFTARSGRKEWPCNAALDPRGIIHWCIHSPLFFGCCLTRAERFYAAQWLRGIGQLTRDQSRGPSVFISGWPRDSARSFLHCRIRRTGMHARGERSRKEHPCLVSVRGTERRRHHSDLWRTCAGFAHQNGCCFPKTRRPTFHAHSSSRLNPSTH